MEIQIILIVVLAVLLAISVIRLATSRHSSTNDAINNIMTRTSVRNFSSTPVSENQIDTLLRAAMAAPSAVNRQPWKFIVIKNHGLMCQIADSIANARPLVGAACAIVVCGDMTKALDGVERGFWIDDCSAATENILLAANALGLGTVWLGIHPIAEREAIVRSIAQLPESLAPLCVVAIGYPDGQTTPKNKWNAQNYKILD